MAHTHLAEQDNPFTLFHDWYQAAIASEPNDPNAMSLATMGADGMPSVRIVLLKSYDEAGFVFYTNYHSRKAGELQAHPHAALCFHWKSLLRQIRIEGTVAAVDASLSDAYFASRPRANQIGAWASLQSTPLASRAEFLARIAEIEARFPDTVPRPPHWGGYKLTPRAIEFWQQLEHRWHDRVRYERVSDGTREWRGARLYP